MTKERRDGLPGFMPFLCEQTMQNGQGLGGLSVDDFGNIYRAGLRYILIYTA